MIVSKKYFVHYTDVRFALLQKKTFKVFFLTITTLADLNTGNRADTTNVQTIFDFRSWYGIPLAQHFSVPTLETAESCRLM